MKPGAAAAASGAGKSVDRREGGRIDDVEVGLAQRLAQLRAAGGGDPVAIAFAALDRLDHRSQRGDRAPARRRARPRVR